MSGTSQANGHAAIRTRRIPIPIAERNFIWFARGVWPEKTAAHWAAEVGVAERTAAFWLAGTFEPPARAMLVLQIKLFERRSHAP
jgi:hypothetical protein